MRQVLMPIPIPTAPPLIPTLTFPMNHPTNKAYALLAGLAAFAAGAAPADAATRTWSGAGGNDQWMTAANWQGGVAPVAGDDLVFPVGGLQTTNGNDFPVGTIVRLDHVRRGLYRRRQRVTMTGTLAAHGRRGSRRSRSACPSRSPPPLT